MPPPQCTWYFILLSPQLPCLALGLGSCQYPPVPPVPPVSACGQRPKNPKPPKTSSPPAPRTHRTHTKGSYLTHQPSSPFSSLILQRLCLCLCSVSCRSPDKGTSISISFHIVPYLLPSPLLIERLVSSPSYTFTSQLAIVARASSTHTRSLPPRIAVALLSSSQPVSRDLSPANQLLDTVCRRSQQFPTVGRNVPRQRRYPTAVTALKPPT